jgi:ketosteroid isomerase-like protein
MFHRVMPCAIPALRLMSFTSARRTMTLFGEPPMLSDRFTIAIAMTLFLASPAVAKVDTDQTPKQFILDWAATFDRNDTKLLLGFYDRSESTEIFVSSGFRHRGYKAVEKAYTRDQKQLRYYDSTVKEISTRILGDTALVNFEHLFKFRATEDDSRWQVHIRTTTVLHRIDGKFKIVLEHSSAIRGIERIVRIED